MHASNFFKTLFFIFLLVQAAIALASPSDDFDAGVQSFTEGNYGQALKHFKRAEKGGMKTALIRYNLGSVYYKLKQYELSKRYFEKLTRDKKLGYLAYYNLALLEHKLGHDKLAIELFEKSAQLTDQVEFKALADKQINTLKGL